MKRVVIIATLAIALVATVAVAERPATGVLWLNGEVVRTIVPPANVPAGTGTAPLYIVAGQDTAIACVGPGDAGYNGGRWAVSRVAWNAGETPYALTSCAAVDSALAAGDVTITRDPEADNRCPIQRGGGGRQNETE